MVNTAYTGTMIDRPRKCPSCGYDLVGLSTSGRCPECGKAIRRTLGRDGDWLRRVPMWYLRRAWLGTWFLAAATFVGALAYCTQVVLNFTSVTGQIHDILAVIVIANSVAWYAGVWIVTSPIPEAHFKNMSALTWVNRGLQAMLPLSVATAYVATSAGALSGMFTIIENFAYTIWVFAIAPFAWQVAELPKNAGDDALGERIRSAGICIVIVLLYGVVTQLLFLSTGIGFLFALVMGVLRLFVVIAGLVALIVIFIGFFQLASMSRWAIRNRVQADARELDKAEAFERARREGRASVPPPEMPQESVPAVLRAVRANADGEIPLAASDGMSRISHKSPGVSKREPFGQKKPDPGPSGDAMI